MAERTFLDETLPQLLGQALSGSFTQVFEQKFAEAERVTWLLIGHASCDVAFTATIAEDSSGTNPTDILSTAIDADEAGKVWVLDIDHSVLTKTKQYISPKVTLTAGTYTLLEIKRGLRNKGYLDHDTTINASESVARMGAYS